MPVKEKEFLSFRKTGKLWGLSHQAIYKMMKEHLQASKLSSRLSIIKRTDAETMPDANPYKASGLKETIIITDFYTPAEIKKKFNVPESWIFIVAKKKNILKTFSRGKTYWNKKHIDAYFASKASDNDITEWYSVDKIREKFGMLHSALYSFVSKKCHS